MLCHLEEAGKVHQQSVLRVCSYTNGMVSIIAGGVLPVLAEQWFKSFRRVHSGITRGAEADRVYHQKPNCHQ